jgi:CMP-N-acetylneuraminic acid synthetase
VSSTVVAIVPMRHDSERVPGKNFRPLGGRPLYHHIVRSLLESSRVSRVVIDTDSDMIKSDAATMFPDTQVLDRPQELRSGMVSMNEVLLNDVKRVDADLFLQTHSTNPFLRPASIDDAIERLQEDRIADSLFSVTRLQSRLWSADGLPINHDRDRLIRTQDLEPLYEENSCIYLFSRDSLEAKGNRIGDRPILYELPAEESWDIDDESDFFIAEAMYTSGMSH